MTTGCKEGSPSRLEKWQISLACIEYSGEVKKIEEQGKKEVAGFEEGRTWKVIYACKRVEV